MRQYFATRAIPLKDRYILCSENVDENKSRKVAEVFKKYRCSPYMFFKYKKITLQTITKLGIILLCCAVVVFPN